MNWNHFDVLNHSKIVAFIWEISMSMLKVQHQFNISLPMRQLAIPY